MKVKVVVKRPTKYRLVIRSGEDNFFFVKHFLINEMGGKFSTTETWEDAAYFDNYFLAFGVKTWIERLWAIVDETQFGCFVEEVLC